MLTPSLGDELMAFDFREERYGAGDAPGRRRDGGDRPGRLRGEQVLRGGGLHLSETVKRVWRTPRSPRKA